ncbi:hypothetical protein FHX83_004722 [Clostridium beijerinckii]|nr:hypothetical protein [Clostridium beijerinckii]
MKYYFAPLEGVTGYVYRNAYETFLDKLISTLCHLYRQLRIRALLLES